LATQAPPIPTRAIALLALAGFASQAMVRVTDSLLPQIAADLGTTVGAAGMVVTVYALGHGSVQLIIGPAGDRFGKYRTIAVMCALAAILVLLSGLAGSIEALAAARFASGLAAGWIIPLSMAYVGDVTPPDRLQPVLARYLSGQIIGQLSGQAAGGILGDLFGWRQVFFILAAVFAIAAVALLVELVRNPLTRVQRTAAQPSHGVMASYALVLGNPWARLLIGFAALEAVFMWGPFAYVGADLHLRFDLSFTLIGAFVGMFGVGGLLYAASVQGLVNRLGQSGLAIGGGLMLGAAYLMLAIGTAWWLAPVAIGAIGLGFYMLHNTLQTNATQMTPEARGTAVALFSCALYLGQTAGVGAVALVIDHTGAVPVFLVAALALPAIGWLFAVALRRRRSRPS
jgi:predicted MFS family arabinose efflux permease